jgi:hypothetical protein
LPAPPAHPVDLVAGLATSRVGTSGRRRCTRRPARCIVLVLIVRANSAGKKAQADKATLYLGKGKSLAAFSEYGAMATAERRGVKGHQLPFMWLS